MKGANEKRLQEFYLRGMLAGYAGGRKPEQVPGKPNSEMFRYEEGNMLFVDEYTTHPRSGYFFGSVIIKRGVVPVWFMYYDGQYPKKAIPLLKAALKEACEAGLFCGGRGKTAATKDDMAYINHQRLPDFRRFVGKETIIDRSSGRELGSCSYRGRLLAI